MDVQPASPETADRDAKELLQQRLDFARVERDEIERAIASNGERVAAVRAALDAVATAVWRDVFAQQRRAKDGDNLSAALALKWFGGYQFAAIAGLVLLGAGAIYLFQAAGVIATLGAYLALALGNYIGFRNRCTEIIKKARRSYLGDDGTDIRFVAFTHLEPGLTHPLIGFDGPRPNGDFNDRSWKIPGVRDDDALHETFVEVIDERRGTVLLTRFPDKKPTLVHADLENPFIRAFGVFFQRALERQLPSVAAQAEEFREIVISIGERDAAATAIKALETELQEYDGTNAIMSNAPVSNAVRKKLMRAVVSFRLRDKESRHGMMLFGNDIVDASAVMQVVARASAASFIPFSFSSMKIGYVGQGAAQVARTFELAKRTSSIIYIEDGERLFALGGASAYESMRREVVQALRKEWDALEPGSGVWVVASAPNRDVIDGSVLAQFGSLIDLAPEYRSEPTIVIDLPQVPSEEHVALPDGSEQGERVRILAAMFAHAETMERQGITVPRGVLFASPSDTRSQAMVEDVAGQSGLPLIQATIDALDAAVAEAYAAGSALVSLHVPYDADPGYVAHLCITIDDLSASKAPLFVLATTRNAAAIDPELRARFGDVIEIPGLESDERRKLLLALVSGKPLDFDIDEALDVLNEETAGMGEERLREYVEEAVGRAALRAIEGGIPDHVRISRDDFGISAASAT